MRARLRRRRRRRRPRQRTRRRLSRAGKIGNRLSTPFSLRPAGSGRAPVAPAPGAEDPDRAPGAPETPPAPSARAPRFHHREVPLLLPRIRRTRRADQQRRQGAGGRTACRPVHGARERRRAARALRRCHAGPDRRSRHRRLPVMHPLPRRSRRAWTPRPPEAQIGPQPTSPRSFWRPRGERHRAGDSGAHGSPRPAWRRAPQAVLQSLRSALRVGFRTHVKQPPRPPGRRRPARVLPQRAPQGATCMKAPETYEEKLAPAPRAARSGPALGAGGRGEAACAGQVHGP